MFDCVCCCAVHAARAAQTQMRVGVPPSLSRLPLSTPPITQHKQAQSPDLFVLLLALRLEIWLYRDLLLQRFEPLQVLLQRCHVLLIYVFVM